MQVISSVNSFTSLSNLTGELKWQSCISCLCRPVGQQPTIAIILHHEVTAGHCGPCRTPPRLSYRSGTPWVFLSFLFLYGRQWKRAKLRSSSWLVFRHRVRKILGPLRSNLRPLMLHSSGLYPKPTFLGSCWKPFNTSMTPFFLSRKSRN